MQCGTAVHSAKSPPAGLKFARPVIIGGVLLGVLTTLPFIQVLFGAWILGGGAVTARLLMKQRLDGTISYGDGAFGGVLSGFVGAIVATLALILNKLLFPSDFEQLHKTFEQQISSIPNAEVPLKELMLRSMSTEISLTTELFWLILFGIFFSLIAMFGGILMVWMSNRRRRRPL